MSEMRICEYSVEELFTRNPSEFFIRDTRGFEWHCKNMRGFYERARGFLGREFQEEYQPYVLSFYRCNSLHSFGMHSKLDLAFIDEQGTCMCSVRQFKIARVKSVRGAHLALERISSSQPWIQSGESVKFFIKEELI